MKNRFNRNHMAAVFVVVLLVIACIAGNQAYRSRADGLSAPEIALSEVEQKPVLSIIQAQRQSNVEYNNQILGIAKFLAEQKGIRLGPNVGEYRIDQLPDGRIRYVMNTQQPPASQ